MRVAIVGVGALGSALAKSMISSGFDRSRLLLVDRNASEEGARSELEGCKLVTRVPEGYRLAAGDLLVLAVKPQDAEAACASVREVLCSDVMVVSVMAGVPMARLASWLEHTKIVRAMPNLGAAVGQSATAYCVSPDVTPAEYASVDEFLLSIGRVWRVQDERLVDAATAVAGSGPAYVCWLAEQMESVARELGIPEHEGGDLVLQTLRATCSYLENSRQSFSELRTRVTSPGGTTAAALAVLDQGAASAIMQDAIRAAYDRAREMGQ
jgi:pyrroline-5-carboxylate reductase